MLSLDLSTMPVLTTPRLVLREVRWTDAPAIFGLRSHPEVMRLVHRAPALSIDDANAYITRVEDGRGTGTCAQWAITARGDDGLIGLVGPWRIELEHHRGELGYMLDHHYWGRGIMSEAIGAVAAHAFTGFGLHSLEAWVDAENKASMRTLEKNGFTREAFFKENIFWNDRFRDSVVYSRLAPPPER